MSNLELLYEKISKILIKIAADSLEGRSSNAGHKLYNDQSIRLLSDFMKNSGNEQGGFLSNIRGLMRTAGAGIIAKDLLWKSITAIVDEKQTNEQVTKNSDNAVSYIKENEYISIGKRREVLQMFVQLCKLESAPNPDVYEYVNSIAERWGFDHPFLDSARVTTNTKQTPDIHETESEFEFGPMQSIGFLYYLMVSADGIIEESEIHLAGEKIAEWIEGSAPADGLAIYNEIVVQAKQNPDFGNQNIANVIDVLKEALPGELRASLVKDLMDLAMADGDLHDDELTLFVHLASCLDVELGDSEENVSEDQIQIQPNGLKKDDLENGSFYPGKNTCLSFEKISELIIGFNNNENLDPSVRISLLAEESFKAGDIEWAKTLFEKGLDYLDCSRYFGFFAGQIEKTISDDDLICRAFSVTHSRIIESGTDEPEYDILGECLLETLSNKQLAIKPLITIKHPFWRFIEFRGLSTDLGNFSAETVYRVEEWLEMSQFEFEPQDDGDKIGSDGYQICHFGDDNWKLVSEDGTQFNNNTEIGDFFDNPPCGPQNWRLSCLASEDTGFPYEFLHHFEPALKRDWVESIKSRVITTMASEARIPKESGSSNFADNLTFEGIDDIPFNLNPDDLGIDFEHGTCPEELVPYIEGSFFIEIAKSSDDPFTIDFWSFWDAITFYRYKWDGVTLCRISLETGDLFEDDQEKANEVWGEAIKGCMFPDAVEDHIAKEGEHADFEVIYDKHSNAETQSLKPLKIEVTGDMYEIYYAALSVSVRNELLKATKLTERFNTLEKLLNACFCLGDDAFLEWFDDSLKEECPGFFAAIQEALDMGYGCMHDWLGVVYSDLAVENDSMITLSLGSEELINSLGSNIEYSDYQDTPGAESNTKVFGRLSEMGNMLKPKDIEGAEECIEWVPGVFFRAPFTIKTRYCFRHKSIMEAMAKTPLEYMVFGWRRFKGTIVGEVNVCDFDPKKLWLFYNYDLDEYPYDISDIFFNIAVYEGHGEIFFESSQYSDVDFGAYFGEGWPHDFDHIDEKPTQDQEAEISGEIIRKKTDGSDFVPNAASVNDEPKAEQVKTSRDKTKYFFAGNELAKARLVHAVVKQFCEDHSPASFEEVRNTFPDDLQGSHGVVKPLEGAMEIFERTGYKRFYIKPNEILKAGDDEFATCNQWAVTNIENFITKARSLGYEIS